jgi:hypothetical protein
MVNLIFPLAPERYLTSWALPEFRWCLFLGHR